MIVADSNLIAYLLIPGDKSLEAEAVFEIDSEWAVPLICRSELRNILTLYMRHQGMTLSQAQNTMQMAQDLIAEKEFAIPSDLILEKTSETNLSSYDAEFVVLAEQLKTKLVTFDQGILKSSPEVAVPPREFAA